MLSPSQLLGMAEMERKSIARKHSPGNVCSFLFLTLRCPFVQSQAHCRYTYDRWYLEYLNHDTSLQTVLLGKATKTHNPLHHPKEKHREWASEFFFNSFWFIIFTISISLQKYFTFIMGKIKVDLLEGLTQQGPNQLFCSLFKPIIQYNTWNIMFNIYLL